MNLLFTSAGRRDYLIKYFAEALGCDGEIHIGNSDPLCTAFAMAGRHVVTPSIYTTDYIPFLLNYCRANDIRAIIPLFDIDLPVLARTKDKFATIGTTVIVADLAVVEMANDKWKTHAYLRQRGFRTPDTWLSPEEALAAVADARAAFPFIVKPRWGMGSIGLMKAESEDELRFMHALVRRNVFGSYLKHESEAAPEECVIIQSLAAGVEYGVDVLNNLEGIPVTTVVKRKLAMRSGETDIAETEDQLILRELGERLGEILQHPGNLDVDVFWDGCQATILELNCRFGGGYPFSHAAGVNFPAAIVTWLKGKEASPQWLSANSRVVSAKAIHPVVLTCTTK